MTLVHELINATLDCDLLAREFATASPFKHIVIDNFLTESFAAQLLAEFPAFERGNSVGDDGTPSNKSVLENITAIGPAYRKLDALIQSPEFLAKIERITGILELLYDPFYLGGGTHENRASQGLQAHIDFNFHPSERWHRRLNLLIYLNHGWNPNWGGNLELYLDPYADRHPRLRIAPSFNRCVIFETSEHSWHGFDRMNAPDGVSRKSIALYFYTKQRPASETAAKHTTHYVDQQLPERFVPSYPLTEDDVKLLHGLIGSRDDHLRRLYAENSRLLRAQETGLVGHVLYLLKRAYVRYRR